MRETGLLYQSDSSCILVDDITTSTGGNYHSTEDWMAVYEVLELTGALQMGLSKPGRGYDDQTGRRRRSHTLTYLHYCTERVHRPASISSRRLIARTPAKVVVCIGKG